MKRPVTQQLIQQKRLERENLLLNLLKRARTVLESAFDSDDWDKQKWATEQVMKHGTKGLGQAVVGERAAGTVSTVPDEIRAKSTAELVAYLDGLSTPNS